MQQDQALQNLITKFGLPEEPLYFGYRDGSGVDGYVILLDDYLIISTGDTSNKMSYTDIKVVEKYTTDAVEGYVGHFIIVTTSGDRLKINLQRYNHTVFEDTPRIGPRNAVDIARAMDDPSSGFGMTAAMDINQKDYAKFTVVETVFRRTLKQHGIKFVENTKIRPLGFAIFVWSAYILLCLTLLGGAAVMVSLIFNPQPNMNLDSTMIIILVVCAISFLAGFAYFLKILIKDIKKQFKQA